MTPNQIDYLLRSLRFFKVVGQYCNFSMAAVELGMSQPRVSQQISQLEKILGLVLFERNHRGAQLTKQGIILYEMTDNILSTLQITIEKISEHQNYNSLRILTDYGFATYWLLPRLADFEKYYPEVNIHLLTTQTNKNDYIDYKNSSNDLVILFGKKNSSKDFSCYNLFQEKVVPICSPSYLEENGPFRNIEDLLNVRLLHLIGTHDKWFSWKDWLYSCNESSLVDFRLKSGLFFGNYPLLLQAVLEGKGIALGWFPLIDHLLKEGKIVIPYQYYAKSQRGYYLQSLPSLKKKTYGDKFIQWIIQQTMK